MMHFNSERLEAKATPLPDNRRKLIQDAAWQHALHQAEVGQDRAIEKAVADMIGASQFLALRLGDDRARQVVAELLKAL